MTPNHQLVADLGATGRIYVALGLIAVVVMLCGVAFLLGRKERKGGGR